MIRTTSLQGYTELVRQLGGDPAGFLSRLEISPGAVTERDAFIPLATYTLLLEVTAAELHCPDFGLRLSRFRGLDVLGPISVIVRNSETVLDAFQAAARFMYTHTPALKLTAELSADGQMRAVYDVTEPLVPYPLQAYEALMGLGVRFSRFLVGPDAPGTISVMHAQRSSDNSYRDAWGSPVRFNQSWCGFEFPASVASQRVHDADSETRRVVTAYLEATYLPVTATLSERVAERARELLPTGHCSVDTIANELAMHPRTLQRRLAAEGITCQEVIDGERRTQAARYLSGHQLNLMQIAGLLGYTEQSAFNRSCRRWFGKTPRQYRAHLTGEPLH